MSRLLVGNEAWLRQICTSLPTRVFFERSYVSPDRSCLITASRINSRADCEEPCLAFPFLKNETIKKLDCRVLDLVHGAPALSVLAVQNGKLHKFHVALS